MVDRAANETKAALPGGDELLDRRRAMSLLGVLLALGGALRLHGLTFQSLWYDELFSVVFAHPRLAVADIVKTYARDVHPLGYPLLLHFWLALFGATDFAARLLSALAGTASIAAMYLLGKAVRDRATGLIAAALTTVNAFHIAYSQEARSYATLFLAAALAQLAWMALWARPSWRAVFVYALAAALALHLHYYGLILVGAQLATGALFAWRAGRPVIPFLSAGALAGLAMLPWMGPLTRVATMDEYWPPIPGPAFAAEYFHLLFGGSAGLTALFAAVLFAAPFVLPRSAGPEPGRPSPRETAAALGLICLLALAVPYVWSRLVVSMMQVRFSMIFLPALLAILALAIRSLPGRWRAAVLALAIAGSLAQLAFGGYYTTVRNEQWREAARWAAGRSAVEGGTTRYLSELAPGFQFYFDQDRIDAKVSPAHLDALEESFRALGPRGNLWLLVARERRGGTEFVAALERRFRKVEERRFQGAAAELWVPRRGPRARR